MSIEDRLKELARSSSTKNTIARVPVKAKMNPSLTFTELAGFAVNFAEKRSFRAEQVKEIYRDVLVSLILPIRSSIFSETLFSYFQERGKMEVGVVYRGTFSLETLESEVAKMTCGTDKSTPTERVSILRKNWNQITNRIILTDSSNSIWDDIKNNRDNINAIVCQGGAKGLIMYYYFISLCGTILGISNDVPIFSFGKNASPGTIVDDIKSNPDEIQDSITKPTIEEQKTSKIPSAPDPATPTNKDDIRVIPGDNICFTYFGKVYRGEVLSSSEGEYSVLVSGPPMLTTRNDLICHNGVSLGPLLHVHLKVGDVVTSDRMKMKLKSDVKDSLEPYLERIINSSGTVVLSKSTIKTVNKLKVVYDTTVNDLFYEPIFTGDNTTPTSTTTPTSSGGKKSLAELAEEAKKKQEEQRTEQEKVQAAMEAAAEEVRKEEEKIAREKQQKKEEEEEIARIAAEEARQLIEERMSETETGEGISFEVLKRDPPLNLDDIGEEKTTPPVEGSDNYKLIPDDIADVEYVVRARRNRKEVGIKISLRTSDARTEKEIMNAIKTIYNIMKREFVFKDEHVLRLMLSTWLMQNGAIILWGIPGTGKTTLIEGMTFLMSNNLDFIKRKYSPDVVDTFMKSEIGTLGVAVFNPDKLPSDIFYDTAIGISQFAPSGSIVPVIPGTILNPIRPGEKEVGRQEYVIEPRAKRIVTAPIKFYNEFNRSNPIVQDGLLRLQQEHEIEYRGNVFKSPPGVAFYDGNKYYITKFGMFPDEALLDRVDVSVNVPNMDPSDRADYLARMFGTEAHNMGPKELIIDSLNKGEVTPLNMEELEKIWRSVSGIRLSRRSIDLMTIILSHFCYSYRNVTGGDYKTLFKATDTITKWQGMSDQPRPKTLDQGDVTFAGAWDQQPKPTDINVTGTEGISPSYLAFIDDIRKQIGHRTFLSLPRLIRAWYFLDACLSGTACPKVINVNEGTLGVLLKYVICHRLGFTPAGEISTNLLNFEMFIDEVFIPNCISTRYEKWDKMLKVGYAIISIDKIKTKDAIAQYDRETAEQIGMGKDNFFKEIKNWPDFFFIREMFVRRFIKKFG